MSKRTKQVVQGLCVSLKDVASALGVSHDTLKGWSSGRTDPSPTNRRALAEYMRHHAKSVQRLASRLEPAPAGASAGAPAGRRPMRPAQPRTPSPGADIRLMRDSDGVRIENTGLSRALRVDVDCFCPNGKSVFDPTARALPIRELQPGASVHVPARFSPACVPPLTATIRWRSPRGESIERWVVLRYD